MASTHAQDAQESTSTQGNDPPKTVRETHHVQDLNDMLQKRGRLNDLKWHCAQSGPREKPTWLAIAYLEGIESGRGYALTKRNAKDTAAGQTIRAIIKSEMKAQAEMLDEPLAPGEAAETEEYFDGHVVGGSGN